MWNNQRLQLSAPQDGDLPVRLSNRIRSTAMKPTFGNCGDGPATVGTVRYGTKWQIVVGQEHKRQPEIVA
jgi:hypothetical protein